MNKTSRAVETLEPQAIYSFITTYATNTDTHSNTDQTYGHLVTEVNKRVTINFQEEFIKCDTSSCRISSPIYAIERRII